jgi:hypothetical protein
MKRAFFAAALLCGSFAGTAVAADELTDEPIVWYADDQSDIAKPRKRDPDLRADQVHSTLTRPTRRNFRFSTWIRDLGGDRWRPAQNCNALGEVPNSTWFTNRIGLFPMTPAEVAQGPGEGTGPDRSGPWTIVSAKTEGVTPGFNIRDAKGDVYLVKFDPPGYPGLTSGSGAIVCRILHAAGYNVPDDNVVTFRRSDLEIGDNVKIKIDRSTERTMTSSDLDDILAEVEQAPSGEYLAISSKFISGTPVGPFDYKGRRSDDPNDKIKHEDRRDLRGLRLLAGWVNHFDTKQHNTLDLYVEEDGKRFVRHYLIDFASSLGNGAHGPVPKNGMEYGFDFWQTMGRLFTVGLKEDDWRRLERPAGLDEVGYWSAEYYNPGGFKPLTPNTAFAKMTQQDGYWAAKIITAFRDEHLEAVCQTAKYQNPSAASYVARVLAERRDMIGREWFQKVCPIDYFRVEGGSVRAVDLGIDRGLWTAAESRYRVKTATVDEDRDPVGGWSEWQEIRALEVAVPSGGGEFSAIKFQVDRGDGFGPSVVAYVSGGGRLVAVDRSNE